MDDFGFNCIIFHTYVFKLNTKEILKESNFFKIFYFFSCYKLGSKINF